MAEGTTTTKEILKKFDAQLECPLCLDTFKQPKILPCFHVFCKSPCLEKVVTMDGRSLTCPICRCIVPLTERGVTGLQSDLKTDQLFELREDVKKIKIAPAQRDEHNNQTEIHNEDYQAQRQYEDDEGQSDDEEEDQDQSDIEEDQDQSDDEDDQDQSDDEDDQDQSDDEDDQTESDDEDDQDQSDDEDDHDQSDNEDDLTESDDKDDQTESDDENDQTESDDD